MPTPKRTNRTGSSSRSHRGRRGAGRDMAVSTGFALHSKGPVAGEVVAEMIRATGNIESPDALKFQKDIGGIATAYLHGESIPAPEEPVEELVKEVWLMTPEELAERRAKVAGVRSQVEAIRRQKQEVAQVAAEEVFIPTDRQIEIADTAAMLAARAMYFQAVQDGHITKIPEQFS